MAKGNPKSKVENKKENNEKKERHESKLFDSHDGKRSPFASFFIKAGSVFLLLYIWSYMYVQKYIPYTKQNEVLIQALKDPELLKRTVKTAADYSKVYNDPERAKFFEKIKKETIPNEDNILNNEKDDDDDEAPAKEAKEAKEAKNEIPPEVDDDIEVIGDMKEEIMGGEIYTVDEILKKLGVKKTSEYRPASEYERKLLKEFKMDREMPENIAKKADYYKPIIERGLKEDERFFVKKINDKKGYGLFANVDIVAHEVLGVYTGVIQESESEKGKKYEWYYSTIPDREKEKMVELRVNGKNEGSALRFVNHSLYYNSRIEYVPYNNQWYIIFVSNRYIRRGEEITVNYREKN